MIFLEIIIFIFELFSAKVSSSNSSSDGSIGGTVKIDFMHNTKISNRTIFLDSKNSTMFAHKAPLPPSDGIWGELIPFSPVDACSALELSNYTKKVGQKTQFITAGPYPHVVALVARGNCTFEEKFDNVDDVPNVIGLLMYDEPNGDNLSNDIEISTFRDTLIPGFLIDHDTGISLHSQIDKMRRNDERDPSDPKWIKVTLKYVAISGPVQSILQFVLLLVMGLLGVAFGISVYMHYHIYRLQRELGENRLAEARNAIIIDDAFMEKLPVKKYHKGLSPSSAFEGAGVSEHKKLDHSISPTSQDTMAVIEQLDQHIGHHHAPPNETCPICLDEFVEEETINELPCGHYYHISCIQPWLRCRSPECPLCKLDVRDAYIPPAETEPTHSAGRVLLSKIKRWLQKWVCCWIWPKDGDLSDDRDQATLNTTMRELSHQQTSNQAGISE